MLFMPFSPEYMNARIEYENTVLGYALLQLDTSFVDIIFNNVAGADYIYYENIATHLPECILCIMQMKYALNHIILMHLWHTT